MNIGIRPVLTKLKSHILINPFHPGLVSQEESLHQSGLTHVWANPIMGRDLAQPWPRPVPANASAREAMSSTDRDRFNSIPGISNLSDILDDGRNSGARCFGATGQCSRNALELDR